VLSVGGANNIPFNTTKGMQDNNGNSLLLFTVTASAVNYVNITNSATANSPVVSALGSDTNILLTLNGKGTSGVGTQGTTAGGNAVAGYVGELISSVIPLASAVSIGTATTVNLTSISLTAGDWDVAGNVNFIASGVTLAIALCWVSATSATLPDASLYNGYNSNLALNQTFASNTPFFRASLSATTTIYISGRIVTAAGGTVTMCGGIYARRVR
jgi:hypothetical protein